MQSDNRRIEAVVSLAAALRSIRDRDLMFTMLSDQFRQHGREGSVIVADLLSLTAAVLRAEVERPNTLQ